MSYTDSGQERPWKMSRKDGLDREEGARGRADGSMNNIAWKWHRSPLSLLARVIGIESFD